MDGDVVSGTFLIEAKATQAASYRVTLATWNKTAGEAGMAMKKPLMALRIQGTDLAVIRLDDLTELLEGHAE